MNRLHFRVLLQAKMQQECLFFAGLLIQLVPAELLSLIGVFERPESVLLVSSQSDTIKLAVNQ